MAATPLTLMDDGGGGVGIASSAVVNAATELDGGIGSNNTIATSPSALATPKAHAIRPTMLFGSNECLDTTTTTANSNALISPIGSAGGGSGSGSGSGNSNATSPSFLPDMPQWKKDLIQRRKTNVARTLGAATVGVILSPTLASQQQHATAADGFTPTTIIGNKDSSKSAIQTLNTTKSTTKVSKVTTSQQKQQEQHATVITAAEQEEQMSEFIKMPTATIATTTASASSSSPTATNITPTTMLSPPIPHQTTSQHNSPTSSNNSTPTKEKSERILQHGGGHYTTTKLSESQASRERQESGGGCSGGDRKDLDTYRQQQIETATTAAMPIPKQRSAYSPIKNISSAATTGITKEIEQEVKEKRTCLTSTTNMNAKDEENHTTAGGGGGADGKTVRSGYSDGKNEASDNCGMYHMQSTTKQTSSPTRAHMSATTKSSPSPLSPSKANHIEQTQQFHLRSERERTYTEQRGTTLSSACGYNNSSNTTTNRVQTTKSNNNNNNSPYSATSSSYSLSNYVIPSSSGGTTTTGSVVGGGVGTSGSGKIFSKLQNNQFIKNQQQQQASAAPPTANITARYKSASSNNSSIGRGGTFSSGAYSPTKTFVAPTAIAIKKKMVAAQEMKKTTPTSGGNQRGVGGSAVSGSGGVGVSGACARGNNRARPPSQTEEIAVVDFDPAEDLSYGPGIVSKLRCRYLSLAFRESMEKERHCLDNMRRATSLNNLLDRDDTVEDDDDETEDDLDGSGSVEAHEDEALVGAAAEEEEGEVELRADIERGEANAERKLKTQVGILKYSNDAAANVQDCNKKTTTFQKNAKNSTTTTTPTNGTPQRHTPTGTVVGSGVQSYLNSSTPDTPRSRHLKRGNDSLKRARSVEALLCERSPWQYVALNRTSYQPREQQQHQQQRNSMQKQYAGAQPPPSTCVTIEDKINNARSRLILGTDSMPPKRLTSVIDDTERPPPDLVKQTLKKFEATANRRGRGPNRTNGTGEVASKVATYKTIIKENKPAIVFPKPPLSPTKKMNAPSLTKPAAKPVVVGGVADLQSSPLGRKAASTNTAAAAAGKTATSNVAAVTAVLGSGLSERSPDIIPRHKLLMEKSEHGANIDSPVTALTKKLEKLRIDTTIDKKQQQQQPQVLQTKETKQSVSQLNKQQQQQQAHSVYDNEFVGNNSELSNDRNQQTIDAGEGEGGASNNEFVGGAGEAANDVALEGNDNNKAAKQNNDRVHTYAKASTSGSSGGELGVVEPHIVHAGIVAISSDLSDDEDGLLSDRGVATTKRITRTALDNIARAGTTQQFKFASGQANVYGNKTKQQQQHQQSNLNTDIPTSVLNVAPGKQIGVIRPLLTTTAAQQAGTIANSNISNQQQLLQQHMEALKQHNVYNNTTIGGASATTTTTHSSIYHSNNSVQSTLPPPPQLTSREIEKNRINEMKKTCALTDGGGGVTSAANVTSNANAAVATAHASLNTVINTNAPATNSSSSSPGGHKSNNSTNAASPMMMSGAAAAAGSSGCTSTSGFSELDAAAQTTANSPLWALRIKRQTPPSVPQENTTMVFNFSNRKEVPDYIENDGVIFRRKRELPKPNESGFVLLGDLSLETSTDSDYDDFSMCPPSPCDVEFENANIVIDGKSSIRFKSKEATFHVQFNDTLTSTFEYPSEASLIIDESYSNESLINDYENDSTDSSPARHHHVAVDEIIQLPTPTNTSSPAVATNADAAVVNNVSSISATNTPTKQILGNLPLGSAPLGFYTPVKAPIDNFFQLGVTRAPNGHTYTNNTSTPTTTTNGTTATNNRNNNSSSSSTVKQNGQTNGKSGGDTEENGDEPESLQYIKPANDDLTIAYSEGTQKTDLLY